ncbi:uncharacterized protein [Dendropsophus ebraccatus]|uniref:uncharacterized protein n=1 Tax=Dendropsophus ebraccatus TaxID=150705 RepID=UPI0038320429
MAEAVSSRAGVRGSCSLAYGGRGELCAVYCPLETWRYYKRRVLRKTGGIEEEAAGGSGHISGVGAVRELIQLPSRRPLLAVPPAHRHHSRGSHRSRGAASPQMTAPPPVSAAPQVTAAPQVSASQQSAAEEFTPQQIRGEESAAVGKSRRVWILGHSFVVWASKRAERHNYGVNLSFDLEQFEVQWFGYSGLRWREIYAILHSLASALPPPDILIIHAGGDDIGKLKTLDLLWRSRGICRCLNVFFPECILVFSEIIPRLSWMRKGLYFYEKIRKRINFAVSKFIPSLGGLSFRHLDLEGYLPGLYWSDLVHLSDIGSDILNANFQSIIELGAVALLEVGPGQLL